MSRPRPPDEVLAFYALGLEADRLELDHNRLERARTQELVQRLLRPAPSVVLDVGGGAGVYALWLAEQGHQVHLVDPVPLHLEQARAAAGRRPGARLASVEIGDARALPFADRSADAVLLLGPLYHLTEPEGRARALAEALRVLRPEGLLFAAAISRFASFLDGLRGALFEDAAFAGIVERDLASGLHRNETGNARYFTTAFFHHPAELAVEVASAGFALLDVFAVEGPAAWAPDFARRWDDPASREPLLAFLRTIETEPSLLGVSPHLLAVGRKTS